MSKARVFFVVGADVKGTVAGTAVFDKKVLNQYCAPGEEIEVIEKSAYDELVKALEDASKVLWEKGANADARMVDSAIAKAKAE